MYCDLYDKNQTYWVLIVHFFQWKSHQSVRFSVSHFSGVNARCHGGLNPGQPAPAHFLYTVLPTQKVPTMNPH